MFWHAELSGQIAVYLVIRRSHPSLVSTSLYIDAALVDYGGCIRHTGVRRKPPPLQISLQLHSPPIYHSFAGSTTVFSPGVSETHTYRQWDQSPVCSTHTHTCTHTYIDSGLTDHGRKKHGDNHGGFLHAHTVECFTFLAVA